MTSLPIHLPYGYIPNVKTGDDVIVGQKIASKNKSEENINIPDQLSVSLRKARKLLTKNPGDIVKKGDIVASKKGFLGLSRISVISNVTGTVLRYERDSGNLVIKIPTSMSPDEIISPVDGKVSLCDNKQIVIDTDKNVLVGEKATGERVTGEIFVLSGDDAYFLDTHAIGKIVVGQRFSREMLLKGIGIGVRGLIASDIADKDIEYISNRKFKTAVMEFSETDTQKLIEWRDKKAFVDPESKSILFLSL